MEYLLVEGEEDMVLLARSDGKGVNVEVLDLMIDLAEHNPEFFTHWIRLAESCLMTGGSMLEA